jgi:hypothetical protein
MRQAHRLAKQILSNRRIIVPRSAINSPPTLNVSGARATG